NDYWMDVVPTTPFMLITDHRDRPGLIGLVGTITGMHDINISFMEVGRREVRGRAMMVLGLDDPMPESVLKKITAFPDMFSVKLVHLRK
ncbi:MAG: ACT domain-containing protein, partial [Chloroflexota bacterium]